MTRSRFTLRRAAFVALPMTLILALAACSGGATPSSAPADESDTPAASDDGQTGALTITAADLAFDTDALTAPAGSVVVTLTNNDTVPHNFSVYTEEGGDVIATGDVINEGETDEVDLGTLEPGTYYFVCDLHPEMNGTLTIEG
jgi:plastocyanin